MRDYSITKNVGIHGSLIEASASYCLVAVKDTVKGNAK